MSAESVPVRRFTPYFVWGALGVVLAIALLGWTNNSTELTPSHVDATLMIGFCVMAVTTAAAFTAVLWLKVPLKGRFISAPLLSLMVGVLAGLLTFALTDRLWQALDFAAASPRGERQFLIDRAYVSHGKGAHYHIQLSEYFADLELTPADYARAFGASEEVRPSGYCLRAPIEQKGSALRIMVSSIRPIPPGRVARCPHVLATP